ncbi:MAG: hypothetical protein ACE5FH_09620, partial [Candidatus Zixiibacteriota bacterium]
MMNDLTSRGAVVILNDSVITSNLLAGVDIFWTTELFSPLSSSEISALQTWLAGGGSLLLEGDEFTDRFNDLLATLGTGIEYSSSNNPPSGVSGYIYPHETTIDVDSLFFSPVGHLLPVGSPATLIAKDPSGGYDLIALAAVGSGRVCAMADEAFGDYQLSISADNQLFGNQVFDWLASGVSWLTLSPDSGTVAVGASQDMAV